MTLFQADFFFFLSFPLHLLSFPSQPFAPLAQGREDISSAAWEGALRRAVQLRLQGPSRAGGWNITPSPVPLQGLADSEKRVIC